MPKLIQKNGTVEIWEFPASENMPIEWAVYGRTGDPIFCPSLGMAQEKAA